MDQKIRVIFTQKADQIFYDISNKFNLSENDIKLYNLIKSFSLTEGQENELINLIKEEMGLPQETAEKISSEIITNIIPLLIKAPEEKFDEPGFAEEIEKQIFDLESPQTTKVEIKEEEKAEDIFPKEKPEITKPEPIKIEEVKKTESKIETPPLPKKKLPKKTISENSEVKEGSGSSDKYREPID